MNNILETVILEKRFKNLLTNRNSNCEWTKYTLIADNQFFWNKMIIIEAMVRWELSIALKTVLSNDWLLHRYCLNPFWYFLMCNIDWEGQSQSFPSSWIDELVHKCWVWEWPSFLLRTFLIKCFEINYNWYF